METTPNRITSSVIGSMTGCVPVALLAVFIDRS
jgi:hypothetical protein